MKRKFLLADDHRIVRTGVKTLLESIYSNAEIDEAYDGKSILEKLKSEPYDLLIVDIQMPQTDTLSVIKYIRQYYPKLPVLVFSMSAERLYALQMLKAGAKGFLSKDASLDELKKAIDVVLNNRRYISIDVAEMLGNQSTFSKSDNPFDVLSVREQEIVALLLSGKAGNEIGKQLNIKLSTVSTHKARIFVKLNVSNFYELKELATIYKQ